ncbi:hypothetical protein ACFCV8_07385 [Streptomyces sp. NPDC056347]|uniref:hypothetical protein n=1 Tax=Streptomyces sp. NPDC056347 TaxID=3345790 RepID=UPI0035D896F7
MMANDFDNEFQVRADFFDGGRAEAARDVPWSELAVRYPRVACYDQWDAYPNGERSSEPLPVPELFTGAVVVMASEIRAGDIIVGFIGEDCLDPEKTDLEVTLVETDRGGVLVPAPQWLDRRSVTFGLPDVAAKIADVYPEIDEHDPLAHTDSDPMIIIRAVRN